MKITKYPKRAVTTISSITISLIPSEVSCLLVILDRYCQGKGIMSPFPNGFPLELLEAIKKVVIK